MADVRRLPLPVTRVWDWQMRAACRDLDSELFFHPANERGPVATARDRAAKVVCAGCPVMEECRGHALEVHEPYGVWGGLTARERETVLRRSHRGRPLADLPDPGTAEAAGDTTAPAPPAR